MKEFELIYNKLWLRIAGENLFEYLDVDNDKSIWTNIREPVGIIIWPLREKIINAVNVVIDHE